ncbi:hypothetical protein EMERY_69 [Brevibacillus phage Emery]|nr:hypothetical protein EMERY_69 [Brevibacillus phage Emery]
MKLNVVLQKIFDDLDKYIEQRILDAKMEVDYELDVLFKALKTGNHGQVEQSKARLHELRRELLLLEA